MPRTPKKPDQPQYFDIKRPYGPSSTSRPIINNQPIKPDPMVSPTDLGSSTIKPTQDNQVPIAPSEQSVEQDEKAAEVMISTTPVEVVDKPPVVEESLLETQSEMVDQPQAESNIPAAPLNQNLAQPEAVPRVQSQAELATESLQPVISNQEINPNHVHGIVIDPALHKDQNVAKKSNSFHEKVLPKLIVGILIIILLAAVLFVVYKYKSGQ